MSSSQLPAATPAPDFAGNWTGLFWGGAQQGIVSAEFTVTNQTVSGRLKFLEPVGDYEADPQPLVGITWDNRTVTTLGVQAIIDDAGIPAVARNLSVIVNEYNLNLGSKSIYLYLKDKEQSVLTVNGTEQIWVDGKVEQIKRALSHAEVKAVKYVRKYGPELNGGIFLALLAFLPSVDSVWHRTQIVAVTFLLLLSLLYAWRLPSNTKIFIREPKPSWWQKHGSAFLLGLVNVLLEGGIAFLIKRYVH